MELHLSPAITELQLEVFQTNSAIESSNFTFKHAIKDVSSFYSKKCYKNETFNKPIV